MELGRTHRASRGESLRHSLLPAAPGRLVTAQLRRELRVVSQGPPQRDPVLLLVRVERTAPCLSQGPGAGSGKEIERRAAVQFHAGQRGNPQRCARLLRGDRTFRPAPRPHDSNAGGSRRVGQHLDHRHLRPRHALPARQIDPLRFRYAGAAGRPLAETDSRQTLGR